MEEKEERAVCLPHRHFLQIWCELLCRLDHTALARSLSSQPSALAGSAFRRAGRQSLAVEHQVQVQTDLQVKGRQVLLHLVLLHHASIAPSLDHEPLEQAAESGPPLPPRCHRRRQPGPPGRRSRRPLLSQQWVKGREMECLVRVRRRNPRLMSSSS